MDWNGKQKTEEHQPLCGVTGPFSSWAEGCASDDPEMHWVTRPNAVQEGNTGLREVSLHVQSEYIRHPRWIQHTTRSCPASQSVRLSSQVELEKGLIPSFGLVRTGIILNRKGLHITTEAYRWMGFLEIEVVASCFWIWFLFQDRQQWP